MKRVKPKGVISQKDEADRHRRSILYTPQSLPAGKRQRKSAEGQQPLFDDVPIDHLKKRARR